MRALRLSVLVFFGACAPTLETASSGPGGPENGQFGVLVMAHGGGSEWNETVAEAVAPLSSDVPAVVAYGMADPVTLESGLDSLRQLGVDRVAVVRVFVSGDSFRAAQ